MTKNNKPLFMIAALLVFSFSVGASACMRAAASSRQSIDFKTFKSTGGRICTNEQGRPLILLFTSSSCDHCLWISDIFDYVVADYVERGLVEAHHYDMDTRDDLLTPEKETRIPKLYLEFAKDRNPEGGLPYFNFGCRYDRIGNGYEAQNDLAAEAGEMSGIIEALISR